MGYILCEYWFGSITFWLESWKSDLWVPINFGSSCNRLHSAKWWSCKKKFLLLLLRGVVQFSSDLQTISGRARTCLCLCTHTASTLTSHQQQISIRQFIIILHCICNCNFVTNRMHRCLFKVQHHNWPLLNKHTHTRHQQKQFDSLKCNQHGLHHKYIRHSNLNRICNIM